MADFRQLQEWVALVGPVATLATEDLERLSDEELLTYLNEWDDEHRDKDNWLIEINISALADIFQTLFKEKIVHDSERLAFWLGNRGNC